MGVTDDIEEVAEPIRRAVPDQPMVVELGRGTLNEPPFRYWVTQDYCLRECARVFAHGAAKAPDLERVGTVAGVPDSTTNTEMDLHRASAADFGTFETDFEATEPSLITGTFGDPLTTLPPCMWDFDGIGTRLAVEGLSSDDRYAEWIEMYPGGEFTELTDWCLELIDAVAACANPKQQHPRELFRTSGRYECRFWDAAWGKEGWSV